MKNRRIKLIICMIGATLLNLSYGQSQQHVWYLNNQQIDFSTGTPVVSAISTNFGAGSDYGYDASVGSAIHDANGNKIFSTIRGDIYTPNGFIGSLNNFEFEVSGSTIIPKPGSSCGYYIVYSSHNPFTDNPNDNIIPYCLPSTGAVSQYNKFYAEIDMSANFGAGSIVSNGNAIDVCTHFNPNPIAVGRELANGNRYLYLAGISAIGSFTNTIKKYLVSPAGITFVNNIYTSASLNGFTAVEMELSHDGTQLAIADNEGNQVVLFHLNPLTGNLISTAGNNSNGTSSFTIPSSSNKLTGVEFSPNGNNLFVGSYSDGIFNVNLLAGSVSPSIIAGSSNYGNSQLELAYDPLLVHRIYAVSNSGTEMGVIKLPNTTTPFFTTSFLTGISAYSKGHASDHAFSSPDEAFARAN